MNRFTYIAIVIVAFLVLLFLIVLLFMKSKGARNTLPPVTSISAPTPNIVPSKTPIRLIKPYTLQDVPTIPLSQGGGLDLTSPIAKASIQSVAGLIQYLPYQKDFTSSSGVSISILIPSQDLQSNTWTLTAQVSGINYETSVGDSDYPSMKESFQEAASDIFSWVSSHNVNPQRIIFSWGDKAYIQQQAERWLSE